MLNKKKILSIASVGMALMTITGSVYAATSSTPSTDTTQQAATATQVQEKHEHSNQELLTVLGIDDATLKQDFKTGQSLADILHRETTSKAQRRIFCQAYRSIWCLHGEKRATMPYQLGCIPMERHRPLTGVKQVMIKQEIDCRWYAIFTVEERDFSKRNPVSTAEIGIDRGLKVFAALSNGEMIENPRFLRQKEKQLRRAQRKLSRKQKGSSNARKQNASVQRLHAKVKHQRKDFLHKTT
jgi:transposase